jgi:hypothetical protein
MSLHESLPVAFTQKFKFANYRVLIKIFYDIEDLCVVIKLGFWVTMLLAPSIYRHLLHAHAEFKIFGGQPFLNYLYVTMKYANELLSHLSRLG